MANLHSHYLRGAVSAIARKDGVQCYLSTWDSYEYHKHIDTLERESVGYLEAVYELFTIATNPEIQNAFPNGSG
jgi:hypothetical protein